MAGNEPAALDVSRGDGNNKPTIQDVQKELRSWLSIAELTKHPGWTELETLLARESEKLGDVLADVSDLRILHRTQGQVKQINRILRIRTECANQVQELQELAELLTDAPEGDRDNA